jgi:hypothetical protein
MTSLPDSLTSAGNSATAASSTAPVGAAASSPELEQPARTRAEITKALVIAEKRFNFIEFDSYLMSSNYYRRKSICVKR